MKLQNPSELTRRGFFKLIGIAGTFLALVGLEVTPQGEEVVLASPSMGFATGGFKEKAIPITWRILRDAGLKATVIRGTCFKDSQEYGLESMLTDEAVGLAQFDMVNDHTRVIKQKLEEAVGCPLVEDPFWRVKAWNMTLTWQ